MDWSRFLIDRAERRSEDRVCEMDCWADGKWSASRVGNEAGDSIWTDGFELPLYFEVVPDSSAPLDAYSDDPGIGLGLDRQTASADTLLI